MEISKKKMNPLTNEISLIKYLRVRFFIYLFNCVPNHGKFDKMRFTFLRWAGFKVSGIVKVFKPISISPKTFTENIHFESGVFINSGARFSVPKGGSVSISKNTLIGPGVVFETVNHGLHYEAGKSRGATIGRIEIAEGVWIGCNAVILPNVAIGKGAVVAAGAVVTRNVESNTVVGGVPAKQIKRLTDAS
jgi:maltose O-acetyltransferase